MKKIFLIKKVFCSLMFELYHTCCCLSSTDYNADKYDIL